MLAAGWGGFVALRYAQRWPEHASKLFFTNPNARFLVPRFDELGGPVVGEAAFAFFEHPCVPPVRRRGAHRRPA